MRRSWRPAIVLLALLLAVACQEEDDDEGCSGQSSYLRVGNEAPPPGDPIVSIAVRRAGQDVIAGAGGPVLPGHTIDFHLAPGDYELTVVWGSGATTTHGATVEGSSDGCGSGENYQGVAP